MGLLAERRQEAVRFHFQVFGYPGHDPLLDDVQEHNFGPELPGQLFGHLEGGAGAFGKVGGYQNGFEIHREVSPSIGYETAERPEMPPGLPVILISP